jgi:hypothetical protein
MTRNRVGAAVFAAAVMTGGMLGYAGQPAASRAAEGGLPSPLPLAPSIREHGTSITPAFEGWYHGKDGFDRMLVGYFNRNTKEEFDIPIGPNNHVDPGGPDQGQPTHFLLGRQWGVFSIKVPKDFGKKALTWTLVVNGLSNSIKLQLTQDYIVEPYGSSWNANTPPVLKFSQTGASFQGPPTQPVDLTLSAIVNQPVPLTAWISDDAVGRSALPGAEPSAAVAPAAPSGAGRGAAAGRGGARGGGAAGGRGGNGTSVTWTLYRGPGKVTFSNAKPAVDAANGGKTETTATFDAPGDYVLRLVGNDASGEGGGGEQCCWTTTHVRVQVKAAGQ